MISLIVLDASAAYVVLAKALDASLVTCDRALADTSAPDGTIDVISF
ncbi:MAG: type II toxin-antitoxin system VapC family toxin [Gammaproteobacteria bacterium]|nr:type II toxin-antitoxin system VapC family toxin [Gammaproteobacteria bacterium]